MQSPLIVIHATVKANMLGLSRPVLRAWRRRGAESGCKIGLEIAKLIDAEFARRAQQSGFTSRQALAMRAMRRARLESLDPAE